MAAETSAYQFSLAIHYRSKAVYCPNKGIQTTPDHSHS